MNKFNADEVRHVAKLANLPLSEEQINALAEQFRATLEFVDQLQAVDVRDVPPTSQVSGTVNVLREDEVNESRTLTQEQALSNAPRTYNGYFVVSRLID